jgi:hypothetical protein
MPEALPTMPYSNSVKKQNTLTVSPGGSKPATYGRFKTSHPEARTSYHLFDLVQG